MALYSLNSHHSQCSALGAARGGHPRSDGHLCMNLIMCRFRAAISQAEASKLCMVAKILKPIKKIEMTFVDLMKELVNYL